MLFYDWINFAAVHLAWEYNSVSYICRNLQNAVCSYYDFEQPTNTIPSMALISDVTVGYTDSTTPNTAFLKKWTIKNCGKSLSFIYS